VVVTVTHQYHYIINITLIIIIIIIIIAAYRAADGLDRSKMVIRGLAYKIF